MTDLKAIKSNTQNVYERQAQAFDNARNKDLMERDWLDRFSALLPESANILDLGCGSGDPIAAYFLGKKHHVLGVDYSMAMLEIAQHRFSFPTARWVQQDMRALDLGENFDGIIAWHSFFHLDQDEQRDCLPRICDHLKPNGVFMTTIGPEAGEVTGEVGGEKVYHASLSEDEYREIFQAQNMQIIDFVRNDETIGGATVMLARK